MPTYYELVCPRCAFKITSTSVYTTCARCGTFFYASQSAPASRVVNAPLFVQPVMLLGGYHCWVCGAWVVNGTFHICWQYQTSPSPVRIVTNDSSCGARDCGV